MSTFRVAFVIALLAAAPLLAQQPPAPDSFELNGNAYHNLYFHLSFQYPAGWVVQDAAEKANIMDRGRDELEKKGVESKGLNASIQRTYNLFTVFRYAKDQQPTGLNPAIALVAENVGQANLADARGYLASMSAIMEKAGFKPEGEVRPAQYGGRQFYEYRVSFAGQVEAHQIYSCTLLQPWAMCFIFSAGTSQQAEDMLPAARTLKFDAP